MVCDVRVCIPNLVLLQVSRRMNALARTSSKYKRQAHPLVRENVVYNDFDRWCSIEKNYGHESQRAWRQNELIGGKPPVVM
jgi:hypothetical protein